MLAPRRLLTILAATATLAALACGDGGGLSPATPTSPSGTALPPKVEATGTATLTPTAIVTPLPPTGLRLLYREFGRTVDTIWAIDPSSPMERQRLASIGHAADWATFVSLSPDGSAIAYTLLPEGLREPSSEAEAWVGDLEGVKRRRVAEGVDLRTWPQWSPDGELVFLRRNKPAGTAVIQVNRDTGEERTVVDRSTADVSDLTIVGFGDDVMLYYIETNATQTATTLRSLNTSTVESATVMRLTEQLARDFALSPDGRKLAFFSPFQLRSFLADIEAATVAELPAAGLQSPIQLHPVWRPDGGSISVGQPPEQGRAGAVANLPLSGGEPTVLASPEKGFDLPLSWSPDGRYLVVRSFQGDSLSNPGQASLVLVSPEGQRTALVQGTDAEPIGWVE